MTAAERAPLLQVRDLRTYFYTRAGVVKAVDGVDFAVQRGEIVGLVGESGSGKSNVCLSILNLVPKPAGRIVSGEIVLEGTNLLGLSERAMRTVRGRDVAMILQDPLSSLNPVFTVGDQVGEALRVHGRVSGDLRERVIGALQKVHIPGASTRLRDYPHQFSGGMRQRVMAAIAISCAPKLLLADEPTTALDVTIQAQILEIMARLSRELGTAVIIITHNLGVVARYADRVNVMYAGRIIETASAKELYANPRHPYTVGLLRSVPRLDETRKEKLDPIEGSPPDLANLPKGCAFYPRCRWHVEKCLEEAPPLMMVAERHFAACWESERVERDTAMPVVSKEKAQA